GVAYRWVDPLHRPVGGGGDDLIQRPLAAQRAVGEFGGQRRVPAGEPGLGQDRRQRQVGVRVVTVHRGHRLVGGVAGGPARRPPVAALRPPLAAPVTSLAPTLAAPRAVPLPPVPPIPPAVPGPVQPLPVAGAGSGPPGARPPAGWGHSNRSPGAGRSPRAQSPAAIGRRPAGWTWPRATGVVAVPTSTRPRSTRHSPGASAGSSVMVTGPSLTRSPRNVV